MATAQPSPITRYLRGLAVSHLASLSDAQLLECFAARRDEAAFTALVRRHGSLVLAACRRILADWDAAQDCFQTTFIVLARRAGSLERPEALGPWLYGVALRTARKARARAARRRQVERHAAVPAAPEQPEVWRDLRPLLDEAVARLPEKYRVPFVMHHLQGVTVAEIARQLGCPQGTAATRLLRAREQLRAGLARRGLTLSAAALTVALSGGAAPACVPAPLAVSMARAATAAAKAPAVGGFSSAAEAQAQGGNAMLIKAKVAALLLAVAVAGGGVVLSGQRGSAAVRGAGAPNQAARDMAPKDGRILFLEGSTRFLLGDYAAADVAFSRLTKQTPAGSFAAPAAELAILARHFQASGAAEAEKVAEGRQLIKTALDTRQRADGQGRRLDRLTSRQAKKDLETADFYERTGHPGSARFYLELVCRRYPGTAFAAAAAERLRRLTKPAPEPSLAAEKSPARVGQIFIVGNKKTLQGVILDQVPLHPGAVLSYPDLRTAERNLEKLGIFEVNPAKGIRPTVTVMDPDAPAVYKDILIQVRETATGLKFSGR